MKDDFIFSKEGTFYRRLPSTSSCTECELPKDMCKTVKCYKGGVKYKWVKDEEMLNKFLESLTPEQFEKYIK